MQQLLRILQVLSIAARWRLDRLLPGHPLAWPARLLLWLFPSRWLPAPDAPEAARLRLALEQAGPIFIKLGQLLATRRDLVDDATADQLALLQDRVAPFPDAVAHALLRTELGRDPAEVFAQVDAQPLAAASVAQVYGATLADGRAVAVKLLRPGVEEAIARDLAVMRLLAGLLEQLWADARLFHPRRVVEQYADTIHAEVDLRREAANSERMRKAFAGTGLLEIPPVHMALTTQRLMVSDRMYAVPVTDTATLDALGIDRRELAERGVQIFFTQVFRDNFFHADMHPGNIFVARAPASPPRYVAVDCAIAGSLTREDQLLLAQMTLALIQRDFARVVRLIDDAGWLPPACDRRRLASQVAALATPLMDRTLADLSFGPTVLELLALAREHHIEAPVQFMLLVKTLVHIEGLGRRLYPALDIWAVGRPLLEQWLFERFGPAAILRELADNAPDWLALLPALPRRLNDGLRDLQRLDRHFAAQRAEIARLERRLRRGLLLLALALGALAASLLAVAL